MSGLDSYEVIGTVAQETLIVGPELQDLSEVVYRKDPKQLMRYARKAAVPAGKKGIEFLLSKRKLRAATEQELVKIKTLHPESAQKIDDGKVFGNPIYVVTGDMEFPAGLFGAHSETFILPKGTAEPRGNPGHSTVIRVDSLK